MILIKAIVVTLSTLVLIAKVKSDQNKRAIDIEWEAANPPFNPNIYEEILDAELCAKQIELTLNDTVLMMTFLEAGPRIPRGILQGNRLDLGNYHQCIGINSDIDDMVIDGKYCQINIGLSALENLGGTSKLGNIINVVDKMRDEINVYERLHNNLELI